MNAREDDSNVPTKPKSKLPMILGVGCLVIILGTCVGGYVVMKKTKDWAADAMAAVFNAGIDGTTLPDDQKDGIKGHINRLRDGFKNGTVTMEDLGAVLKEMGEGALPVGLIGEAYNTHVPTASKNSRDYERFARGVFEKKINTAAVQEVLAIVSNNNNANNANGQQNQQGVIKDKLTDEELKKFVSALKRHADDAKIPNEAYKVDIAKAIGETVDKALNK